VELISGKKVKKELENVTNARSYPSSSAVRPSRHLVADEVKRRQGGGEKANRSERVGEVAEKGKQTL